MSGKGSHVYNSHKIGHSVCPTVRLGDLEAGSPIRLILKREWQLPSKTHALFVEKQAHERFISSRAHGEWFTASLDSIYAYIDGLSRRVQETPEEAIRRTAYDSFLLQYRRTAPQKTGTSPARLHRVKGKSELCSPEAIREFYYRRLDPKVAANARRTAALMRAISQQSVSLDDAP